MVLRFRLSAGRLMGMDTTETPVYTLAAATLQLFIEDPLNSPTMDMMKRWEQEYGDMPIPIEKPDQGKWWRGRDARCSVCAWPLTTSGHEDGFKCPDLVIYRYRYEHGQTLALIALNCDRPTSYIRARLLEAGAELRSRGRRGKEAD